jgi:predicted ArsR family transcriptional regulator
VVFGHCPFAELAEAHPEVVCHLHRGIVEGFVEDVDGIRVRRFGTLVDRRPCSVDLSS